MKSTTKLKMRYAIAIAIGVTSAAAIFYFTLASAFYCKLPENRYPYNAHPPIVCSDSGISNVLGLLIAIGVPVLVGVLYWKFGFPRGGQKPQAISKAEPKL
jgi:hypothetical protein